MSRGQPLATGASLARDQQGMRASSAPKPVCIVVTGSTSSGKSTQAALLAERYSVPCVSVDALLAEAASLSQGMMVRFLSGNYARHAAVLGTCYLQNPTTLNAYKIMAFSSSLSRLDINFSEQR